MSTPDLSIIIVSWNVADLLCANLQSLPAAAADLAVEIFVVDNHSSDKTVALVREKFPAVHLIVNHDNLGFARANNLAIRASRGRYVLLLNPDMLVSPGALKKMTDWLDRHPDAGVAGGRLRDKQGRDLPHVRRWPTVWDQSLIILKLPHLWSSLLDNYLALDFDYRRAAPVDSVRGSFFFIRRALIDKVGGLDERYFLWFEEVDYCRQARAAGYQVYYAPVAEALDYHGRSFAQVPLGRAQDYFRASMLAYFQKWQPTWQGRLLRLAWPVGRALAWLAEKFGAGRKI